ncbi:hypothetical protein ACTJIJ_22640 [Niabella sp. 22666]|uniref:hypothetical protein n=1 Tax=Niabella sp. 22666 TaxID=3453954 RepID=UPI003F83097A
MKWYKFLFFKYYGFAEAVGFKSFFPEVQAWVLATFMPWFNLMTILLILKNNNVLSPQVFSYIVYASFFIGAIMFVYIVLMERYKLYLQEYTNKKGGGVWVFLYSLITVGLYFWVSNL